jgi:CheY-like chemotaxis protein
MANRLKADSEVPKVLIADDDQGIARFLANRCAKLGFEVQTANDGLQALTGPTRPDVLIADINMPDLNGLALAAHLLDRDSTLKVIVITSSSYAETAARCQSLGAYYVRKGAGLWEGVQSALLELFPHIPKDSEN